MNNLQISLIKTYIIDSDRNIIEHLLKLSNLDNDINLKLFSTNNSLLLNNSTSILPIYEAKYISDIVFVWDLLSLELVRYFPNLKNIYYLQLDDLPWINHEYMPYTTWDELFNNPQINVVVDDIEKQKIVSAIWNNRTICIDKLNLKELYEILKSH